MRRVFATGATCLGSESCGIGGAPVVFSTALRDISSSSWASSDAGQGGGGEGSSHQAPKAAPHPMPRGRGRGRGIVQQPPTSGFAPGSVPPTLKPARPAEKPAEPLASARFAKERAQLMQAQAAQARGQPAVQPEPPPEQRSAEKRQNLNLHAALDAADLYFRGPMPPDTSNRPMNYLRAKEFARTVDLEVDPELRLVLGCRPKMTTEAELTPREFLEQLRPALMEVTGIHAAEDPDAAWEAHVEDALAVFSNRQQQYNLLMVERGDTVFEGGHRGQEKYLERIVELYVPEDHEYSAHIRQSLQVLNANPDWTFHAKEWILRRMIFGLVGAPREDMDAEAVQNLVPKQRDWKPMDVYATRPELIDKLQRNLWLEDVKEGSSKPAFVPSRDSGD